MDALTNGAVKRMKEADRGQTTLVLQPLQTQAPGQEASHRDAQRNVLTGEGGSGRNTALLATNSAERVSAPPSQLGQPAQASGPMLRFVDSMTDAQAAAINTAITQFIVGCALPFAIVTSVYFVNLLRVMRPAFIEQGRLRSRSWFSRRGLEELYDVTQGRVNALFQSVSSYAYATLAGDGFKTEAGHKIVNFTEMMVGKVAFKNSVSVDTSREDYRFYVIQFREEIKSRPLNHWCGVVGDNVGYMRVAFNHLETEFPNLLFYGCVAHLLDLLCEDYADLLADIISEIKSVVVFVVSHSRVKELFLILKGPSGMGLRTFPDTRFSYAALMTNSVLINKRNLKMMLLDDKWEDVSSNSNGTAIAGRASFEESVNGSSMWRKGEEAYKLLNPVAVVLRYIEANYACMSFVYPLMISLLKDVAAWNPSHLPAELKHKAHAAFAERWTGQRIENGSRIVPLFHPVHLVAFYLNPYLTWTADNAVPTNLVTSATQIFSKFCETDAECRNVRQAFEKYCAGVDDWSIRKQAAQGDAKAAYQDLLQEHLKQQNCTEEDLSHAQKAVLQCQAVGDKAITWWMNNCKDMKLREASIRILSCSPHAAVVERMNSMHKLIQSKTRAALKHERVVRLLYCYVNMRLLDNVDTELLNMVEEALLDEIDREEQEQIARANEVAQQAHAAQAPAQQATDGEADIAGLNANDGQGPQEQDEYGLHELDA